MTITFPKTVDEAVAGLAGGSAEVRAGASDWMERHELGLTAATIVDLRDLAELGGIERTGDGGFRVGARVTLAEMVSHGELAAGYPALVEAADALATPQIRRVATLGGALLQRSRCWYYRSAEWRCFKSGGEGCPAREGDHHFHACFDRGPCVAPHPSTVGMALLTYDGATVEVAGGEPSRSVAALFGDGSDPTRDHQLGPGELLTAVRLPPPTPGERGGYFRAIGRAYAEWPLVEASVRLVLDEPGADGVIALARVALGGVANVPLRLPAVESVLEGTRGAEAFARAGEVAAEGATPLPATAYKVALIPGSLVETLERALAAGG